MNRTAAHRCEPPSLSSENLAPVRSSHCRCAPEHASPSTVYDDVCAGCPPWNGSASGGVVPSSAKSLVPEAGPGQRPLIFGIDETLERLQDPRISALRIYRDAVGSSRNHTVKASGPRWVSLMWLGYVPRVGHHWALPVLTVLAPSSRYHQHQGRRHKKVTDWAQQMVMQLRRWLPHRPLVLVGDNGYAVLDLLHCSQSLREPVTLSQIPFGHRPLCASATTVAGPNRSPSAERPQTTIAESLPGSGRRALDRSRSGLVRRHYPYRGTHLPRPPSGTARENRPALSAGCWREIPKAPSIPRPSSAPTRRRTGPRSWSSLSCAGNSRSPFRKRAPIWAWRPNASGPTWPSPAPRRLCWASSPGPPWPPTPCKINIR